MVLAYLLVAQGQYARAVAFLAQLFPDAETQGRFYRVMHVLALQSESIVPNGDHTQAIATLERALSLAALEGR